MVDVIRNIDDEDIEDNRGKQIKDYINNNKVDRFIILDDMDEGISSLFPNEYIQVNRFYGLDEEVAGIIRNKMLASI